MKKFQILGLFILMLILTSIMFVGACKSTPTPATTVAQPIVLRLAPSTLPPPPALGQTLSITALVDMINTRTKGRIQIEVYWSQTLVKSTDITTAIQTGLADIAILRPYGEPGKLPLSGVGEMPGISDDLWSLGQAYYDLSKQEPLASELAKWNIRPIASIFTPDLQLISNKPIRSLADVKGKKVAAGGIASDLLKEFGAAPLVMSPTEQYEGLYRGTIDCIAAPYDAMDVFKFWEVGKFVTNMSLGPRIAPLAMSTNTWNKLPADIQKIFNDSARDFIAIILEKETTDTFGVAFQHMKDAGVEIITLSAEDTAKIKASEAAYGNKWAADQEAQGLAGKKVLSDYKTLTAKYEPLSPYKKK